jgi:hypothetical protein
MEQTKMGSFIFKELHEIIVDEFTSGATIFFIPIISTLIFGKAKVKENAN